ncbi:hypothetical protein MN116_004161 [Schistosoma mekongi]|uniref:CAAX prenyl protease 2 n=1 Tax=Schistosoma mekongi TaxID=38744 RepID=A0AAE2D6F8_SCHME|nr:hypothetical protein MN116_004161 [Schistosoma mekongi]
MHEVLNCILYASLFISGLYFAGGNFPRDHPETIKRRVVSVFVTGTISMIHVLTFIRSPERPLFQLSSYEFGKVFIRLDGLFEAVITSIILTLVLYLGVLLDDIFNGNLSVLFDAQYWKGRIFNWISFRNFVIAPLAEELIFRACITFHLLPLFSSCIMLCFISSLFFSVSHFHHIVESIESGQDLQSAFQTSLFQVFYTTLFGMYSGFLMLRTGNIASSIVTHSLCNFFGLPDLMGAIERAKYRWGFFGQVLAVGSHLLGLCLWTHLLYQITDTKWSSSSNCHCNWY